MRKTAIATVTAFATLTSTLGIVTLGHADTVSGTRSNQLYERAHTIALRFERTHATLVVRRTFENLGPEHDQAMVQIADMPPGAIAIGLRTQAVTNGQTIWYAGELLEAELAAKRYRSLTGIGGHYPKDPALLSWHSVDELALQVFPIEPKGTKVVEYTLAVPVTYAEGRYRLVLPRMGTTDLSPTVTMKPGLASDVLVIDHDSKPQGFTQLLDDTIEVSLVPTNAPTFDANMASVSFGTDESPRALLHTAIALPPRLSKTPEGAYVVVVLDASRSLSAKEHAAEIAAAESYLMHFVDPHIEVLTFDRIVRARHGKFVSGPIALGNLATEPIVARNGSALELALAQAKTLLGNAPAGAAKRVIVLTDLRTRDALKPGDVKGLESAGAIVHLGVISEGGPFLARDDDNPWSAVVRPTGGLVWHASARSGGLSAKTMLDVYEEWARPRKLDRVSLSGIGLSDGLGIPETMREGTGFEDLRITSYATPALEVHGELWATKVSTLIAPTKEQDKLWSALVFGDETLRERLTEPQMMVLAMKGGAVSPVTSYLAIEPGVRPSTIGLEWDESFGAGGLGLGFAGGFGSGSGTGSGLGASYSPIQWLRAALREALDDCGGAGRSASVKVETTSREIVDVGKVGLDGAASTKDAQLRACIVESLWALELPSVFKLEHPTYSVTAAAK